MKINNFLHSVLSENKNIRKKDLIVLLEYVFQKKYHIILLNYLHDIDENQLKLLNTYTKRLQNLEPIEYIIQNVNFCDFNFYVDQRCLIPRIDSEVLIKEAISYLSNETNHNNKEITILDICSGSGCLGISFALKMLNLYPNIKLKLNFIDKSKEAIEVLKINLLHYNLTENSNIHNADILSTEYNINQIDKADIIFFNPPYIKQSVLSQLDLSVINYEPLIALDGGVDGLSFYNQFAKQFFLYKKNSNSKCFIEIGYDQKDDINNIFSKLQADIKFIKDENNIDRCCVI